MQISTDRLHAVRALCPHCITGNSIAPVARAGPSCTVAAGAGALKYERSHLEFIHALIRSCAVCTLALCCMEHSRREFHTPRSTWTAAVLVSAPTRACVQPRALRQLCRSVWKARCHASSSAATPQRLDGAIAAVSAGNRDGISPDVASTALGGLSEHTRIPCKRTS